MSRKKLVNPCHSDTRASGPQKEGSMKNDRANLRSLSAAIVKRFTLPLILSALSAHRLCAQAPGLLWTTNVGANVFAADSQTNVYANANGTVITLNANGQPF